MNLCFVWKNAVYAAAVTFMDKSLYWKLTLPSSSSFCYQLSWGILQAMHWVRSACHLKLIWLLWQGEESWINLGFGLEMTCSVKKWLGGNDVKGLWLQQTQILFDYAILSP